MPRRLRRQQAIIGERNPEVQELRSWRSDLLQEAAAGGTATRDRVSRLPSNITPLLASWIRPTRAITDTEYFIPYPKITFLLDQPAELVCQICRVSPFLMKPSDDNALSDSTCSILPCGHAAGSICLERWMRIHRSCPFCRFQAVYPGCGHAIPARPVTEESVHLLPRTVPDGGSVPALCAACNKQKLTVEANARFEKVRGEFQHARWRFAVSGDPTDESVVLLLKNEFENVMKDDLHRRHMTSWLDNW